MLVREAVARCPNLIVKTAKFEKYEEVSLQFYDILWMFSRLLQVFPSCLVNVTPYSQLVQMKPS